MQVPQDFADLLAAFAQAQVRYRYISFERLIEENKSRYYEILQLASQSCRGGVPRTRTGCTLA
jgi:hypothetical protein